MSEKILNSAMTIENKVIDCTLMPDEKFQVLKNALDLANDPNRGCKMYFGTVLPEDMTDVPRWSSCKTHGLFLFFLPRYKHRLVWKTIS